MSSNRNESRPSDEVQASAEARRATRRPSHGREERDVDATGTPRLLSQCEDIKTLKVSGHALCPNCQRRFVPRLRVPRACVSFCRQRPLMCREAAFHTQTASRASRLASLFRGIPAYSACGARLEAASSRAVIPRSESIVFRPSHWLSFLNRVEKPSPESQDFGEFALNRAVAKEMYLARNVT